MDPRLAAAVILVLCLVLVVAVYVLGVEVGKATWAGPREAPEITSRDLRAKIR